MGMRMVMKMMRTSAGKNPKGKKLIRFFWFLPPPTSYVPSRKPRMTAGRSLFNHSKPGVFARLSKLDRVCTKLTGTVQKNTSKKHNTDTAANRKY